MRVTYSETRFSGVPLGGLGTGSFEVSPDGRFREWLIFNNRPWSLGGQPEWYMSPDDLVFFLRVEVPGQEPQVRGLFTGLWYATDEDYTYRGCGPWVIMEPYHLPWAKGVESIELDARPPVVTLSYRDRLFDDLGLRVSATFYSPIFPGDVDASSVPAVLVKFRLENAGSSPLRVSIMAVARNPARSAGGQAVTEVRGGPDMGFILMRSEGLNPSHPMSGGQMAVAFLYRSGGASFVVDASNRPSLVNFMRRLLVDFRGDGAVEGGSSASSWDRDVFGALHTDTVSVEPGSSAEVRGVIAWYYPNHVDAAGRRVGHYYERLFADVTQVLSYVSANRGSIERRAEAFSQAIYSASYSPFVSDLVSAQLTSIPKLSWLTRDGHFGLWEGGPGCCGINTVDVMLWAFTGVVNLYPELVKAAVRDFERHVLSPEKDYYYELFALAYPENMQLYREALRSDPSIQNDRAKFKATIADIVRRTGRDPTGRVPHSFRASFDLIDSYDRNDLMPELLLISMLYFFATGDEEFLRSDWRTFMTIVEGTRRQHDLLGTGLIEHYMPSDYNGMSRVAEEARARDAVPGFYRDAVRHLFSGPMFVMNSVNTFDTFSLNGVAAFTGDLWAASLRAMSEAAGRLGIGDAGQLSSLSSKAYSSLVSLLWNGEYFDDWYDPVSKLRDRAVLAAQLVGEWYLELLGLGNSVDNDKVVSALRSVYKHNFRRWEGVLNGVYPGSPRPSMVGDVQAPNGTGLLNVVSSQADTPWTGVEFGLASQMLYNGMVQEALEVLRSVHERYLSWGLYFNHLECNGHYSRPLAALTLPNAMAGATYDGWLRELRLSPVGGPTFTGPLLISGSLLTVRFTQEGCNESVELRHLDGKPLRLRSLKLPAPRGCSSVTASLNGAELKISYSLEGGFALVKFQEEVALSPGQSLVVKLGSSA